MKRFWRGIRSHFWIRHVQRPTYTPPQRRLIIIIAGNYRQFHNWCYENNRRPLDAYLRYIGQGDAGRRLCGAGPMIKEVRFIGTYRSREDIDEVISYVDYYQNIHTDITVHYEPWSG